MPRCALDNPATFSIAFRPDIISYAVWLYHRYGMSFRDVEDLLAERGIIVSYETIRQWCGKFGPDYARRLKRRQGRLGDTWFLDEVFVTIKGQRQYLWRAVDQDGDLIDVLLQPRRDGRAARRFFRKLLQNQRQDPVRLVTDKPGQLPRRTSGRCAVGPPRHDPIREPPRRSLPSADATPRTSDARLHLTRPRAAVLACSRCYSESISRGPAPPEVGSSSDAARTVVQRVGRGNRSLILSTTCPHPGPDSLT